MSKAATTEAMRLITSNSHAISKTPVEIWDEILKLATTVKNGDEFGDLNTFGANLSRRDIIFDCYVSLEDEKYALATRRSVVLVCRAWHAIAIRFLWSHLIIHTDSWMFKSFYTIFLSPVELWHRVKRLDIVYSPEEDPKLEQGSHMRFKHLLTQKIYPRLSNLQTFCGPQNLAVGNYTCSPAIVSLYPAGFLPFTADSDDGIGRYEWVSGNHFWTSARILDLDMDLSQLSKDSLGDGEYILFPQLKKLRIRSLDNESTVDHIIEYWKTPILEVLSLRDCYTGYWAPLLVWSSKTVTTLELSAWNVDDRTVISMPRLRSLVVENYFRWEDIVEAPNLIKLSFSDKEAEYAYYHNRERFTRLRSRVIGHYPMCTSVSFFTAGETWVAGSAHSQRDGCQSDPDHCGDRVGAFLPVFEFDPTDPHTRAVAVENRWLPPL